MTAIPNIGFAEQPSPESSAADRPSGHTSHASPKEFGALLGHALRRSSLSAKQNQKADGSPAQVALAARARAGAPAADSTAATGVPGDSDVESTGEPTLDSEGCDDGARPHAAASRKATGRKRHKGAADRPSTAAGHEAAAALHAAIPHPAPPGPETKRAGRITLSREDTALLAAAPAAKQPLAPAQATKHGAYHGRDGEKSREHEAARTPEAAAATARLEAAGMPAPADAKVKSAGAHTAPRQAPPLPPPPAGQEVAGAVLRNAAHLRVETGDLGALSLHLRVREGALHLSVDGAAARTVEARAGELSRALAAEGLRLAPIETHTRDGAGMQAGPGDGDRQRGEQQRETWNEAADARETSPGKARLVQPRNASASPDAGTTGAAPGTVHVTA